VSNSGLDARPAPGPRGLACPAGTPAPRVRKYRLPPGCTPRLQWVLQWGTMAACSSTAAAVGFARGNRAPSSHDQQPTGPPRHPPQMHTYVQAVQSLTCLQVQSSLIKAIIYRTRAAAGKGIVYRLYIQNQSGSWHRKRLRPGAWATALCTHSKSARTAAALTSHLVRPQWARICM
jgi:hypothetical protein